MLVTVAAVVGEPDVAVVPVAAAVAFSSTAVVDAGPLMTGRYQHMMQQSRDHLHWLQHQSTSSQQSNNSTVR